LKDVASIPGGLPCQNGWVRQRDIPAEVFITNAVKTREYQKNGAELVFPEGGRVHYISSLRHKNEVFHLVESGQRYWVVSGKNVSTSPLKESELVLSGRTKAAGLLLEDMRLG
jgi:hypothetical protein